MHLVPCFMVGNIHFVVVCFRAPLARRVGEPANTNDHVGIAKRKVERAAGRHNSLCLQSAAFRQTISKGY